MNPKTIGAEGADIVLDHKQIISIQNRIKQNVGDLDIVNGFYNTVFEKSFDARAKFSEKQYLGQIKNILRIPNVKNVRCSADGFFVKLTNMQIVVSREGIFTYPPRSLIVSSIGQIYFGKNLFSVVQLLISNRYCDLIKFTISYLAKNT